MMTSVAQRLGVNYKSLNTFVNECGKSSSEQNTESAQQEEIKKLKADLKRVSEERCAVGLNQQRCTSQRSQREVCVHKEPAQKLVSRRYASCSCLNPSGF